MRSYLSLIPISAKVHRRQNRMTLLCIIFAVFLVTAIFSMADMGVRCETMLTKDVHGDWQIQIDGLSARGAKTIEARDDVAASSWYEVVNMDESRAYRLEGHQVALCGIQEPFCTEIMSYFPKDASIAENDAIVLTPNARELLGVDVGSRVTVETPEGNYHFKVTGFRSSDSRYASNNGSGETTALLVKDGQIGAFMNIQALHDILSANNDKGQATYFVQFAEHANIRQAIEDIQVSCGIRDSEITQNFILMGLAGLSDNTLVKNIYPLVAVLFLLVLLAGVLMISGSLNSTIARRTQFFGMMRCLGMSRAQVKRFVRLEALNWCKTAIPMGALLGIVVSWGLGAILHYWVGGEFSQWPVFGVSIVGVVSGVLLGIFTVLIAAQSPARRASRVTPMAAVSGNSAENSKRWHQIHLGRFHIESQLGMAHATEEKKSFLLMSGSFALSIILFLSFSVLVELLGCLLPTSIAAPDLSIQSKDWSNSIDHAFVGEISEMPGVAHAFGRSSELNIPATFDVEASQTSVDLISYDDLQLDWLPEDDMLREGSDLSQVYGNGGSVLVVWDETCPLEIGDIVSVNGREFTISGMLKYSPFSNDGSTEGSIDLICSNETFEQITGTSDYGIIDVQMMKDATDKEVEDIQALVGSKYTFVDRRDEGDRSTYWAFSLFIYGFLVVISLITVLHIVNSISMSVTARTKQYGAMRAVGMDGMQLTRMIATEAATYAGCGFVLGLLVGTPFQKVLYDRLITAHFPYYSWELPINVIFVIFIFTLLATIISYIAPARRIRRMAVCETINEL